MFSCSNSDSSFTMAHSNSFLSHYEIFPSVQENKYLEKFSYFIMNMYVKRTHLNRIDEAILKSSLNIHHCVEDRKGFPNRSPFS